MGQPTVLNPPEGESPLHPPMLGFFELVGSLLQWLMTIVAIILCGMLLATVAIPSAELNQTAPETPPTLATPFSPWDTPPKRRGEQKPRRIPIRIIDLPPLVDTSDWKESSPQREQPFLRELEALNFNRPVRSSADYHLSGADLPTRYDVYISVRIRGEEDRHTSTIEGKSFTHFKRVGAASNTVELHAFGLYVNVHSLACDDRNLVVTHHRNKRKQSLIITANEEIQRGSSCVLELTWNGVASTDSTGLYETWYTRKDGNISVALTTHGETMHTRKWMPCFDEPRFKTPFKLAIEHSSDLTALSNGRIVSIEKARTEGRSITTFEETWPISTYLHAFSVTDYVSKSTVVDGLPVSVFVPPTLSSLLPKIVKDVAEMVPLSLKTFKAAHLNSKLDFVFFPDHTSAMENPGHISLGTGFIDAKETLVHEMMHQYFGNLLTLNWWSDVWINEGLANYYEDVALAKNDPMVLLSSVRRLRSNSIDYDVYDTGLPLHNTVNTFIDSRLMFRNPYNKGSMVINMLRDYAGAKEFDGVIEKLLHTQANSTLSLQQFLDSLVEIGEKKGQNAVNIAKDFFELRTEPSCLKKEFHDPRAWWKYIGYPLIVVRHVKGTTMIRQVRFHRGFVDPKQRDFDTRWTIPVHLTTLDGSYSRVVVMEKEASEITLLHPDLLIVDPSRVVNYRVVYERQTYEEIHRSKLSDEDKDVIELDLVEAAAFGYVDAVATYDTIMRRSSRKVVNKAHNHLMGLFRTDNANFAEATGLMEKLSGHKLARRQRATTFIEHPLRQRRNKRLSEIDDDMDYEAGRWDREEKELSIYCPTIKNMTEALREYNKLDSGSRNINPLKCILERIRDPKDFERWIYRVFDNHDHTFHSGDRLPILDKIARNMSRFQANATFVQDIIVGALPRKVSYYETVMHNALQMFGEKHTEQLKRLIVEQPKTAAENWVDIASVFERVWASKSEAEILGPKVVEALKKLTRR